MEKHKSKSKKNKTYTVSLTFTDMSSDSPLAAAKKMCKWLLENNDAERMCYDVINEQTNKAYTVDLSEEDEDEDAVLPN